MLLKVTARKTKGKEIADTEGGNRWIITEVLGDGKFKAVTGSNSLDMLSENLSELVISGPDETISANKK